MTTMRTILITGVTGKRGRPVVQRYRAQGFHLRGLTRTPNSHVSEAAWRWSRLGDTPARRPPARCSVFASGTRRRPLCQLHTADRHRPACCPLVMRIVRSLSWLKPPQIERKFGTRVYSLVLLGPAQAAAASAIGTTGKAGRKSTKISVPQYGAKRASEARSGH